MFDMLVLEFTVNNVDRHTHYISYINFAYQNESRCHAMIWQYMVLGINGLFEKEQIIHEEK